MAALPLGVVGVLDGLALGAGAAVAVGVALVAGEAGAGESPLRM
ncbi:exported hypothetical protein [Candidatus Competibacter denitrificans Run_A_D11]|uniref:Uncharacterized protein n=1 Tax=Candidatus Competibacter denitrificans Run_A_D11 TaxID=1400863 RepID=W6M6N1_9GAMM|nr:exported hypothetical protein [Candidatus Competibacter denitrificans Run_A_D11]